ncbi:MAG: hypothetical protein M3384_17305 [Acidobacteriota bacterium]|nr:hypothetical protein [Acidobacteriota bacterium]
MNENPCRIYIQLFQPKIDKLENGFVLMRTNPERFNPSQSLDGNLRILGQIPIPIHFGHSRLKTKKPPMKAVWKLLIIKMLMAEPTGLEPATSNVTGQNSVF